jgi:hypothetical protein
LANTSEELQTRTVVKAGVRDRFWRGASKVARASRP